MGRILAGVLIVAFACGFAVGQEPTPDCDLNNDGKVDSQDLFLFMREWHRVTAETTFTPTPTQVPTLNPTSTPAPPTMTPEPPTYTISGYVAEFPGCGGRMRGVTIALLPLGATTESSLADGSFSFSGIPNGEYTLTLFGYCNPFGCYPDTPVTVAGEDVFVEICPLSGATPTPTETHTPVPTQTLGPEEITVNLPGLPADATPLVMVRIPAGTLTTNLIPLEESEEDTGKKDIIDSIEEGVEKHAQE